MARIYDALKRAERERTGKSRETPAGRPEAVPGAQSLKQKLIAVYKSIESSLPDKSSPIITFVGAQSGEGTSTLVREFAKLASSDLGRKTVILDVEQGLGGHYDNFGVSPKDSLDMVVNGSLQLEDVLLPVKDGILFLGCLSTEEDSASTVVANPKFDDIMKRLREKFNLILFDAPPLNDSSDALLLAPKSDGVVIVVEAEKTRWQVAESVREKIVMQGGNILGVILNKRRFHIPQFIYRRL